MAEEVEPLDFEKDLVPLAIDVKFDLLQHIDPKIRADAATDVLDRSKRFGKNKGADRGLTIQIGHEAVADTFKAMANAFQIDGPPPPKNVTPAKKPKEIEGGKEIEYERV